MNDASHADEVLALKQQVSTLQATVRQLQHMNDTQGRTILLYHMSIQESMAALEKTHAGRAWSTQAHLREVL